MIGEMFIKGEEVTENLLDLAKSSNDHRFFARWANRKVGAMVDIENTNELRFIEYNYTPPKDGKNEDLHPILKEGDDEELTCPIVASGIIAFWLKNMNKKALAKIFEDYYDKCKQKYIDEHEFKLDAIGRDLVKDFALYAHLNDEIERIDDSVAIYPYLQNEDVDNIQKLSGFYLKFIRDKYMVQYPPKYTKGREKQEAFLSVYENAAKLCVNWVLEEYNIRFMNVNDKDVHMSLNPDRYLKRHNVIEPRLIRWEYKDFDFDDIYKKNSCIIEEIKTVIDKCTDKEDRIRYIKTIFSSFKDFSEPFYPNNYINLKKREIEWDRKLTKELMKESGENKKEAETESKIISFAEEEIAFYQDRAQKLKDICRKSSRQNNEKEIPIELILCSFWHIMHQFYKKLGALVLTYKIDLMDVQDECGVYLINSVTPLNYVDDKYIPNISSAQKLLLEIHNNKSKDKGLRRADSYKKESKKKKAKKNNHFTEATFTCLTDDKYKEQRIDFFIDALWKEFVRKDFPKEYIRNLFTNSSLKIQYTA